MHQIKRFVSPENVHDYEYIFGPFTQDIKTNSQQNKRHGHWNLPDTLKDHNKYLTEHHSLSQRGTVTLAANLPSDCSVVNHSEQKPKAQIKAHSIEKLMARVLHIESLSKSTHKMNHTFTTVINNKEDKPKQDPAVDHLIADPKRAPQCFFTGYEDSVPEGTQ